MIVELDGYEFHSSKDRFRSDRENDADALTLDIVTVRVTTDRLRARRKRRPSACTGFWSSRRRRAA